VETPFDIKSKLRKRVYGHAHPSLKLTSSE
jgi:hypothetical protein